MLVRTLMAFSGYHFQKKRSIHILFYLLFWNLFVKFTVPTFQWIFYIDFFYIDFFYSKESGINLTSRQEERASSANGVIEVVSQSQNGSQVLNNNNNNNVNGNTTQEKQRIPSPPFTKKPNSPVHSVVAVGSAGSREKRAGSPVILPPISRDGSLIGDESNMWCCFLWRNKTLCLYFLDFFCFFYKRESTFFDSESDTQASEVKRLWQSFIKTIFMQVHIALMHSYQTLCPFHM